jgi:flagellar hook assembly protein FlgD
VRLEIYSSKGERIAELLNEMQAPGRYEITWEGRNDSGEAAVSGIYFVRLAVEQEARAKKILLVK